MTGPPRQPSPRVLSRPAFGAPGQTSIPNRAATGFQPAQQVGGQVEGQGIDPNNGLRKIAFQALVVLIFIRFSMLHQLFTYKLGVNLYLLFIFGIPPIIGVLLTGGFARLFRNKTGVYWLCFGAIMLVAVPFSRWPGGSAGHLAAYFRVDFIMLFVMVGLAATWKECRAMMYSLGLSGLASVAIIQTNKQVDVNGRISLDFGTIQNSNDYAAHLMLVLPFLMWIGMTSKSFVFRIISFLGVGFGFYQIMGSASRGALVALVIVSLVLMLISSAKQRAIGAILLAVMAVAAVAVVPTKALQRMLSYSSDDSSASEEALMSSNIRKQLFQDAVIAAVTHPIFGLGMGQFSEYAGTIHRLKSDTKTPLYFEAHNSYLQVASENGLIAIGFYVAGIVSTLGLLTRINRKVKDSSNHADIRNMVYCFRVSYTGFCVSIAFINFGYFFYLPALAGMVIAMTEIVEKLPVEAPPQPVLPTFAPQRKPLRPRVPDFSAKAPARRFDTIG